MSLADNYDKVAFATYWPIDKIVYESPVLTYVQGAGSESTSLVDNPYGRKCFITLAWSFDQTNWYPAQAFTTLTSVQTVNGWVDASNVYIHTRNGAGSSVTFYVKFVLDTIE